MALSASSTLTDLIFLNYFAAILDGCHFAWHMGGLAGGHWTNGKDISNSTSPQNHTLKFYTHTKRTNFAQSIVWTAEFFHADGRSVGILGLYGQLIIYKG